MSIKINQKIIRLKSDQKLQNGLEFPKGTEFEIVADVGRRNISKSLIGNTRHKGHKHSEETKKQISESKKGTVSWNAQSVLQLDKEDNIINEWRSASDAAKNLGLSQGNIWSVINGDRNTCGGFKWKLK